MRIKALAQRWVWLLVRSRLIKGRFASRPFAWKRLTGSEANVLMCLWNRPTRLPAVLDLLDSQDHPGGVRLFLWNNNRADHPVYLRALQERAGTGGALVRVDIVRSPLNFGSIGRFFWARKIAVTRPDAPVIVLDDDQDIRTSFVREAIEQFDPRRLTAWWAWTVGDTYWERHAAELGDRVDHVGPGGMICRAGIFADERFFTEIPDEFRMLDDIWLTYFARREGYALAKLAVDIDFVMDETNQFHTQTDLKPRFFDHLYGSRGQG